MTESAHVRGQVWRPDGRAATDAVVTLTDPQGAQVGSAPTGAAGMFEVPVPAEGRYLMVVAAPGHDPWVRYVTAAGADVEMPVVLNEPASAPGGTGSFSAFGAPAAPQAPSAPPAPLAPEPPYLGFSTPPEPPATHVASTPAQGFPPARPYTAERFGRSGAEQFAEQYGQYGQYGAEQFGAQQFGRQQYEPEPFASEPYAPEPFAPEPDLSRRQDETLAVAAQAALNAIAEGRPLPAQSLYGLVTALLASRIDLETDPDSALARTAARIGATRGGSLPESRDAADAILAPLARQLLTDDSNGAREDAADPENVIALLRPLIEALATDLEARVAR